MIVDTLSWEFFELNSVHPFADACGFLDLGDKLSPDRIPVQARTRNTRQSREDSGKWG